MNSKQASVFFEKKFQTRVSPSLLDELVKHYAWNGLIDMRRVIRDAMALEAVDNVGDSLSLTHGRYERTYSLHYSLLLSSL
jgi:hypothetical protein